MSPTFAKMLADVEALGTRQCEENRLRRLLDARRHRHHLAHLIAAKMTTFDRYLIGRPTYADRRNARVVARYFARFGGALQMREAA